MDIYIKKYLEGAEQLSKERHKCSSMKKTPKQACHQKILLQKNGKIHRNLVGLLQRQIIFYFDYIRNTPSPDRG